MSTDFIKRISSGFKPFPCTVAVALILTSRTATQEPFSSQQGHSKSINPNCNPYTPSFFSVKSGNSNLDCWMKLREIDKQRYSKHYKIVFAAIVVELMIVSIVCSTLLISWFSTPEENHFILNITGVVFAALLAVYIIYRFRDHSFMEEVVYVWNLKKQLNRIYRKQRKIEPLIEDNNVDAMIIMNYMYQGSKQLYELDDNTITLDNLAAMSRLLDTRIERQNIKLTTDDYHPDLLRQF